MSAKKKKSPPANKKVRVNKSITKAISAPAAASVASVTGMSTAAPVDSVIDESSAIRATATSMTVADVLLPPKKHHPSIREIVLGLEGDEPFPEDSCDLNSEDASSKSKKKGKGIWLMLPYVAVIALVILGLQVHSVYIFRAINNHLLSKEMLISRCTKDTGLESICRDAVQVRDAQAAAKIGGAYKEAAERVSRELDRPIHEFSRYYFSASGYYEDYTRYWYSRSAWGNNREGLYYMYQLYTENHENRRVANEMLLRSSAAQGYPPALLEMYEKNIGGSKKHNFNLLLEAANSDYLPAEILLGREYADGTNVERNLQRAQLWMVRAVRKGSLSAMLDLVRLYASSEGELPDARARHYAWARHFYNCQREAFGEEDIDLNYSMIVKMVKNLSGSLTPKEAQRAEKLMNNLLRDYPCTAMENTESRKPE